MPRPWKQFWSGLIEVQVYRSYEWSINQFGVVRNYRCQGTLWFQYIKGKHEKVYGCGSFQIQIDALYHHIALYLVLHYLHFFLCPFSHAQLIWFRFLSQRTRHRCFPTYRIHRHVLYCGKVKTQTIGKYMLWNYVSVRNNIDICLEPRKRRIGKRCRVDNYSFISLSISTGYLCWVHSLLCILKLIIPHTSKTNRHEYHLPYWWRRDSLCRIDFRHLLLTWFSSHDSFFSISSSLPCHQFPTSLNFPKSTRGTYPLI